MKRYGNLFEKIIHKQNLLDAHKAARKGKTRRRSVKKVEENLTDSIGKIHNMLKNETYTISEYEIDSRTERGKERTIYKLPYYPDRIIQHAIMQIVEPILLKTYIKDTYQSIKKRGVHKAKDRIKKFLKDEESTKYVLKIDIQKFYPNVNNKVLKQLLRKKIKCKPTLRLLDSIIDSTKGLPIGNYLSQMLGNYYLTYFDHYMKEKQKCKHYIRYADDIVIFSNCKTKLSEKLGIIKNYLKHILKIKLKSNYQIFPLKTRGLGYLGFRFFRGFTIMRKSIKKGYLKTISKIKTKRINRKYLNSIMSYYGWIKHSNSHNLMIKTITVEIKEKIALMSKIFKINNPILNIKFTKPKRIMLKYYQPTLF